MAATRLFRHPDRANCARCARWHRRLDWLGHFEDSAGISSVGLPHMDMGEVVVLDLRHGTTRRGAAGLTLLRRQIPTYRPLLPLLRIPPLRRRVESELNGCADGGCSLDRRPDRPGRTRTTRRRRAIPPDRTIAIPSPPMLAASTTDPADHHGFASP